MDTIKKRAKIFFVQLVGFGLGCLAFLVAIVPRIVKQGWSAVFSAKDRPLPPAILHDERWGEHKYMHVPGAKLHYVEKGDNTKPLMVMVHGFPEFWFSWRHQLEYFSKDYWCVALDNRGYGDSDKPSGVENYDLVTLSTDIKNLVEGLGRKECILVGHDWGGAIGYRVCQLFPEIVKAYIAINIPHPMAFRGQIQNGKWEQIMKSWYIIFFQCPFLPELSLRLFDHFIFDLIFEDMKKTSEKEIIEAYKFTFKDRFAYQAPINYYRGIIRYPLTAKRTGTIPVCAIFGTGDKYISVQANKDGRKFITDFEETYLEGVGHFSQAEAPEKVNEAMEKYLKSRNL